jgi:hypothetical protein
MGLSMRNDERIELKELNKYAKVLYPRGLYIFMAAVFSIGLIPFIMDSPDFNQKESYIIIALISLFIVLVLVLFLLNEKQRYSYLKLIDSINGIYQFISNPIELSDAEIEKEAFRYAIQLHKMDRKYTVEEWKSIILSAIKEELETNQLNKDSSV